MGRLSRWFRGFYCFRLRPFALSFNEGAGPLNFTILRLTLDEHRGWFVYMFAFGWRHSWNCR